MTIKAKTVQSTVLALTLQDEERAEKFAPARQEERKGFHREM